MTGSALLTFIATILAAQPGTVEIDLGSRGGLRAGDEGVVFYEVVLEDEVRAIDLGPASVIEVSKFTSRLEIAPDLAVRPGFLVRFDLPRERVTGSKTSDPEPPSAPESAIQSVTLNEAPTTTAITEFVYVRGTGGRCLKLRSQPTEASKVRSCVSEGTPVEVLEEAVDWTEARIEDGTRGWLASRYLSATSPPNPPRTSAEPRDEPAAFGAASGGVEAVDSQALLLDLEQAEARVDAQLRELEQSQAAFYRAHEDHNELSRRLLEATVADYESRLTATDGELKESQKERAELAEQYQSLQIDFSAKDDELARAKIERQLLIEKLEATNSELAQIEKIATTAKDALRSEISNAESAVAALRSRLEQREKELAAAQAKLAQAESENRAIAQKLESAESTSRSSLEAELEKTNLTLRETQREKQTLEAWLEERAQEVARAEAKVATMQSEIDRLETIAPLTHRDIENTRALLEDAKNHANAVVLGSAQPCLNFRAEPKLDGKALDCLEPGTRLGALGHWEGWHYVELTDGRAGWVSSRHLERLGSGGSGP